MVSELIIEHYFYFFKMSKRKRNVIDDADGDETISKYVKIDDEEVAKQIEMESKAVRVHPFDVPELASRILFYMLNYTPSVLQLAATCKRYL